jgi:hypothetical protein
MYPINMFIGQLPKKGGWFLDRKGNGSRVRRFLDELKATVNIVHPDWDAVGRTTPDNNRDRLGCARGAKAKHSSARRAHPPPLGVRETKHAAGHHHRISEGRQMR